MGAIDVNCQVYDNWDWLNKSWSNPKELLKFWKEDQEEEELDEVRTTIFQICVFDPDFLNHEHLFQPHAKLLPCTSWAFARFPASEYVWRPVNSNDKATFPACGASWRGEGQDPSLKLAYYSILLLMFHAHPPKCLNETAHWLSIPSIASIPVYSLSGCCWCLSCIHKAASRTDLLIKEMNSLVPPSKKKPLLGDRSKLFRSPNPGDFRYREVCSNGCHSMQNRSWLFWQMILANKIITVVRWIEIHSSCIALQSKR